MLQTVADGGNTWQPARPPAAIHENAYATPAMAAMTRMSPSAMTSNQREFFMTPLPR